jgi:peptidyl-prolyl cis-trans isomerase D
VSGLRTGNLFGGDDVAAVGHTGISSRELDKTVRAAFDGERQRTPTLTMKDFVTSQNALEEVLSGLIDRAAVQEWGQRTASASATA